MLRGELTAGTLRVNTKSLVTRILVGGARVGLRSKSSCGDDNGMDDWIEILESFEECQVSLREMSSTGLWLRLDTTVCWRGVEIDACYTFERSTNIGQSAG